MDLICRHCGEPLDMDELHDIPGMTFDEAYRAFRNDGCAGVGFTHNPHGALDEVVALIYAVLGDDVDGAASELELLGYGD